MASHKPRRLLVLTAWVVAGLATAASAVASKGLGEGGADAAMAPSPRGPTVEARADARSLPPFVSQFQEHTRRLESTSCGPAAMTSVAKSLGVIAMSERDDAVIEHLSAIGHTSESGTSVDGMTAIATSLGLKLDWMWGTNLRAILEKLREGSRVIAGGNALALPWRGGDGVLNHYIVVADVTARGTFLVYDPMDRTPTVHEISPGELAQFNVTSPGGGVTLAIARAE